jgi:hypothetical protein
MRLLEYMDSYVEEGFSSDPFETIDRLLADVKIERKKKETLNDLLKAGFRIDLELYRRILHEIETQL